MRLISQSRGDTDGPPELNIAPLIDMVFILLIFFLVTTSFVRETGVKIDKPSAKTAEALDQSGVLIAITESGTLHFQGRAIDLADLQATVRAELALRPDAPVVLIADKASRNGMLVEAIDACKAAGATHISLAAERPR